MSETEFNPEETALVVVDMQNDFCHPDGALYAKPSGEAISDVNEVIRMFEDAGSKLVFTRDVHPQDQFEKLDHYDEFERWCEHVIEGEWGAEIHEEIDDENADLIVEKQTYDAFHETNLESWLEENQIENVVVVGTLANVCILHTASSAALNDYRSVVVSDAVGYLTEDDKEYALDHIEWLFGEVMNSDNIHLNSN